MDITDNQRYVETLEDLAFLLSRSDIDAARDLVIRELERRIRNDGRE